MLTPTQYDLEIRMLGSFEARFLGNPIPRQAWGRQKSLAIAKYLLAHRHESVSIGRLAELFYDNAPVDRIRSNVRGRMSEIRRALWPDRTHPDFENGIQLAAGSSYRLDPHISCWIDVESFEHYLQAANQHYHQEMWRLAVEDFARAHELYRGDFLADDLDEPWTWDIRERLSMAHQSSLTAMAACLLHLGKYRQAAAAARRAQELDPLDEEAYRFQIEALAYVPDKAAALQVFQELRQALAELGEEPDPEIEQLVQRIQRGTLQPSTPGPRHNLRQPLTSFFGREQELAALKQHLAQDRSRLVTLLGPGGMGKTRLALEAGRQLASAFRDGVFYVPLPGYKTSQALAAGIAQAIGFSVTRPNMGVAELSDFLSNKQMLLIIDAAETATDVMPLFETLTSAPGIQLLVTSRRRIHFPGEFIIDVAGLPYPADPTDPMQAPQTPAYRLFVDRYERLRPRFRPTDEEKDAIARVCRMVAGMPLAIEMAASWGRVLTCQEIADRIASFEPLTAGLEDREQGLSGVFSFSWEMLTKIEQQAALRLSTFAGSFSRAAGEYVGKCPASTIMALVDNSFLQWDDQGRFRIHEVIRSYLRRRLNEDPDAKAAASRIHDGYFAELLDSDPATSLPQAQLQALTPDLPNIQQAWLALERGERTLARTRLTLAGEALHALHDDWYGAHALSLLGVLSRFAGELDRARQLLEQCLAIQQRLGDTRAIAGTLLNLGAVYGNLQQWDEAERYFRQARRYAEEGGHRLLLFFVLGNSAFLAYRRSLLDKAEALGLGALDLSIDLGHKSGHAQIAYYLALVALDRRSPGQALPYLRRALEHSLNARAVQLTLQAMHGYARYFALEGRYETAAALLYFVLNQSGYPKAARTRSEEVLAEVTPNLTARQQARAARKAAEGTLDAFVEELRQVGSGP